MDVRRRRVLGGVVAAAVAATIAVPITAAVGAPRSPQPYEPPRIAWESCEESLFGPGLPENYSCALYPVPLDHNRPTGDTIDLALVKRAADDPSARLGSLFVNPGGPGGSGLDIVAFAGDFLFDPQVTAAYDLIGFDPRGISASTPLQCFEGREDPGDYIDHFLWPRDRRELRTVQQNADRLDWACRQQNRRLVNNMSSTDVVKDMEILRQAVGDPELNFVGYSYGSYLAAVYANLYPDTVGAIVADGVIDPAEWAGGDEPGESRRVPLEGRLRSDLGAQATLEEFFRLCDEAGPDLCAFAPDSASRYEAMIKDLAADPLVVSFPGGVFDDQLLAAVTLGGLYSSVGWQFLAFDLAFFEQVAQAEGVRARSLGRQLDQRLARLPYPAYYVGQEQFLGVVCSDSDEPDRLSAWSESAEQAVGPLGQLWAWNDRQCVSWRGDDRDRYEGPWNAETANPVLVASTRFDPATDYAGALALDEYLPNSILLTVEGWGHTTPFLSACADALTTAYLLREDLGGDSFTCEQDIDPFAPFDFPEEPVDPESPGEPEPEPDPAVAAAEDLLVDDVPATQLAEVAEEAGAVDEAEAIVKREAFIELVGPNSID